MSSSIAGSEVGSCNSASWTFKWPRHADGEEDTRVSARTIRFGSHRASRRAYTTHMTEQLAIHTLRARYKIRFDLAQRITEVQRQRVSGCGAGEKLERPSSPDYPTAVLKNQALSKTRVFPICLPCSNDTVLDTVGAKNRLSILHPSISLRPRLSYRCLSGSTTLMRYRATG